MPRKMQVLEFAIDTAKEAGEILMKYFGTKLTKKIKTGPGDYATEADEEAEKFILVSLNERFSKDVVIAEESGKQGSIDAEYTWIIDPLDGTHNFASGSKDFGVMICRACGGELELAVVWNPAHQILATAVSGQGAYLNGRQVDLQSAEIDDKPLSVEKDNQAQLKAIGYGVTNLGASANTLITLAGERRSFISSNGFIWDFAPPALLLAEAGWKVTDFRGQPFKIDSKVEYGHPGVIAAKPELHEQILNSLLGYQLR